MFDDLEQTRPGEPAVPQALQLAVLGPRDTRYADLPERGAFVVGRARGADLRLTDPQVSRRHLVMIEGPSRRSPSTTSRAPSRSRR